MDYTFINTINAQILREKGYIMNKKENDKSLSNILQAFLLSVEQGDTTLQLTVTVNKFVLCRLVDKGFKVTINSKGYLISIENF